MYWNNDPPTIIAYPTSRGGGPPTLRAEKGFSAQREKGFSAQRLGTAARTEVRGSLPALLMRNNDLPYSSSSPASGGGAGGSLCICQTSSQGVCSCGRPVR